MQSSMVPLNAPLGDGRGAGTVVVNMPEHPPDYVVWSIASFIYGVPCCLGLIALIFSIKSRDRKMVGDLNGAKAYGSKAFYLNGFTLALTIIISIIIIVVIVVQSTMPARPYRYY
ncbi:interferon-induced transmembrane protein 3-like [Ictalurus furcatus]|uniref:interferon-induced transmembrane protein 3-like n=1 Tax=Ictalurus furcatus TaxID=66913 RepID=UPI0023509E5F|nr:interferon-induced transmembrane protein 3-like [Ictalurus furcatus]